MSARRDGQQRTPPTPDRDDHHATDTPEVTPPAPAPRRAPDDGQDRGTLPMAHHLTDPAIEEEIQALAASAPPMTEDQRATVARLLRLNRHH